MVSDAEMHAALCGFLQSHHGQLPYTPASVSFVDEGLFTTVRRMRTGIPIRRVS